MAKIGILVAYEEILNIFNEVLEETDADVVYKKTIATENVLQEARNAINAGAEIIIARGYQAKMIKMMTNIPVVDIRIHTQEIGMMIKRGQNFLNKKKIKVGLVTYKNMLSDLTFISEMFDIELLVSTIDREDDIITRMREMIEQGVEIFFGGANVFNCANDLGYPALIYQSSYESVKEALRQAENIGFAMKMKEETQIQLNSVMDTTFNGLLRIGVECEILTANKLIENMVHKDISDIIGKYVWNYFPEIDQKILDKVLSGESDNYVTSINVENQAWMVMIASVKLEEQIIGAIISFQKNTNQIAKNLQKEMFLNGYVAKTQFSHMEFTSPAMKNEIANAKKYAISDAPIVMECNDSDEYYMMAEAIHNNSNRKNYPFVSCNVRSMNPERQMLELFGLDDVKGSRDKSAFHRANDGTLLIKSIEKLKPEVQYQIVRIMMHKNVIRTDTQEPYIFNVRIIAVVHDNFYMLMERGEVVSDLFYMMNGLNLRIPPLSERPEDLIRYFKDSFKAISRRYSKYLALTNGAVNAITQLPWTGNTFQIKSFCERLVLSAEKRNVDEVQITKLYYELFPMVKNEDGEKKIVIYKSAEADQLSELLKKYHGNRVKVAEELGISTTTLWRRMKKYGIEPNYMG